MNLPPLKPGTNYEMRLYWISGSFPGRIAILPRPRGHDWLEDETRAWKQAQLDLVVSLLTPDEVQEFGLEQEGDWCFEQGIQFVSYPILDRTTPANDASIWELIIRLADDITDGKNVGVHCRQGIGRAALITAAVLRTLGLKPDEAIQRVSLARGCPVPETFEQRRWILETTFPTRVLPA